MTLVIPALDRTYRKQLEFLVAAFVDVGQARI